MAKDDKSSGSLGEYQTDNGSGLENPQLVASEMAKAFQELARGEQAASALERQLDGIESRIDQLLAAAEESARLAQAPYQSPDSQHGANGSENK